MLGIWAVSISITLFSITTSIFFFIGKRAVATQNLHLKQKIDELAEQAQKSAEANLALQGEKSQLEKANIQLEEEKKHLPTMQERDELKSKNVALETSLKQQEKANENLESRLKDAITNLTNNITTQIVSKQTSGFEKISSSNLDKILRPLQENIKELQERSVKQQTSFTDAMNYFTSNITTNTEKIQAEAQNLTNVLKGDNKKQGEWGELTLKKLLENSGLQEGREYILQAKDLGLKNEEGAVMKPDVTINLPDGKYLFIDSKVTLTSVFNYHNSDGSKQEQDGYFDAFLKSINKHADDLQKYFAIDKGKNNKIIDKPELIFMFTPEFAYNLLSAKEKGQALIQKLYRDKRIAIVSPNNLMMSLILAESLWKLQKQNENSQEIAKQAGQIYAKATGFIGSMADLGKNLTKATESFNQATNRLSTGKGNLMKQAKKLEELGASTKILKENNKMPEEILQIEVMPTEVMPAN